MRQTYYIMKLIDVFWELMINYCNNECASESKSNQIAYEKYGIVICIF